jgi:hypothetical protein
MGGSNSGRWSGRRTRRQVESCYILPAPSEDNAPGVLQSEQGFWCWPRYGLLVFYERGPQSFTLSFKYRGVDREQRVSTEKTRANLGGSRVWFLCPGCSRRCSKLYLPPRESRFLCRLCHDLSYESAQTSRTFWDGVFKNDARRLGVTSTRIREMSRARHAPDACVSHQIGRARAIDTPLKMTHSGRVPAPSKT